MYILDSLKSFFIPPFSVFYYIILVHFFIIYPKIDNIILVITQSGSPSLLTTLDRLEQELAQVSEKIEAHEQSSGCKSVDPAKVVAAYRKAQQMFLDGTLPQRRQLINLYVKRVVVYDDYVRIELHNVPGNLKGNDAKTH